MRDARPQGRQERRAGRNRNLARRSGHLNADVLRVAAAIVVDACAFSLWNLAARSPARLARDVAAGVSRPAVALRGVARFVAGMFLLFAGAVLLLPLAFGTHTFTVLETWTVLTGLLVDQLLGSGARTRAP
jgi:VIT1/CCC1 family predicted Fe2+/Mn2+ transporter